jgi:uncharacterized protein YeaO (DUF488 family)
MEEEKSKKEIFKDVIQRKRMDKVYQNLSPSTSFADLKKHSGKRFKEISARLKEETRKRKEKKELRKQKIIEEKIEGELFDGKGKD